jgi:hypothetical protein
MISGSSAFGSVNPDVFYTPAVVVHEILLICAVICLIWASKVLSLVRGGLMSKSWQMFMLGFVFLAIAQVLAIIENAQLVIFPEYLLSLVYLIMSITWLFGLYQLRKVLG